jgi:alpha-tubulin suppressor-like RCC1 family protein
MPLNETTSNTTVQYTVTTTNTADGTVLYWRTTGNTTNSDIVGGNTGTITIINNRALLNVTIIADETTDGTKTLGIAVATGSQSGPTVISTENPIIVNDTSLAPQYRLFLFGQNNYGQLGLNDTSNRASPTQLGSDITWSKVSGAIGITGFIKTDGTLWTSGIDLRCGRNGLNNRYAIRSSPTQVGTDTTWRNINFGYEHVLATKTDGTLWAWGRSSQNETNVGTRSSPTQIGSSTNWNLIGAGFYTSIATKTDGTLWVWGYNAQGQLGLNNNNSQVGLTQVGTLTNWSKVSIGIYQWYAIKTDGTLWASGMNSSGELGINQTQNYRSSPVQVGTNTNWSMVSAGRQTVAAIKTDGTLWVWGYEQQGEFGLSGGTLSISSPTQVGALTNWKTINLTGTNTAQAVKLDGTLWSWGWNNIGQLGLSSGSSFVNSPTQVGTGTNWSSTAVGFGGIPIGSGSFSATSNPPNGRNPLAAITAQ